MASLKAIRRSSFLSDNGILFNFTVKVSKEIQESESVFFEFIPVFIRDDGMVSSEETTQAIVSALDEAKMTPKQEALPPENAEDLFEKARDQALTQCAQYQPWDDDVFCLNALRVEAV